MSSTIAFDIIARDRASDKFDRVGDSAHRSTGKLKNFAKVGGAALLVAAGAAVKFGVDSVQSLGRIEKINAQTTAAIKSTGGAAGVSQKHVEGLAGKIEALTASEAEAVQEGANLLLTFTNIQNGAGKGNKVFDQATHIMNDMSVAMGTDVKSSAMLVGKALNDPVKGMTALSRAGVQLNDGQKKTIETLVKSGDTMGAQKIILKELETQFGGSGKAFADTAQGKFALVGHKFGEIGETIMTGLMPALSTGADKVLEFMTQMQTGEGAGGKFRDVMVDVGATLMTVGGFVKDNAKTLAILAGALGTVYAAFKTMMFIKNVTLAVAAFNAVLVANPIGLVVVGIALLAAGLVVAYKKSETFRTIVDKAFGAVKSAGTALWENGLKPAFAGMKKGFEAVGKAGTWLWNNALQPAFKFIIGGVASILDLWSTMLENLAKVPGFGWAKKAADAMSNAADKARGLADGIKKIPNKTVTVTVAYKYTGRKGGAGSTRGDSGGELDPSSYLGRGQAVMTIQQATSKFFDALADSIKKGGKKLDKVLDASRTRLRDKLGGIRDEMKSMGESIASALNQVDFSGSLQEHLASLTGTSGALAGLTSVFESLKNSVSKGYLSSLMQSGNIGLATALANDPAAAAQASALYDSNAAMAQGLGDQTAQQVLGDKIEKALKDEIGKMLKELKDAPSKHARELRKEIKELRIELTGGSAGQRAYLRGAGG